MVAAIDAEVKVLGGHRQLLPKNINDFRALLGTKGVVGKIIKPIRIAVLSKIGRM
jgi:hypothetical protein